LLAYLDPPPSGSVYAIDIDTNGEVDFNSIQLPSMALAWAAVLVPTAAITFEPSAPFSRERQRATSAS
jgi:hypothetical protein